MPGFCTTVGHAAGHIALGVCLSEGPPYELTPRLYSVMSIVGLISSVHMQVPEHPLALALRGRGEF
jgi:hypothetical protein